MGFGPDGEEYRGGGGAGGDMVVGGQPCAEAKGGNHPHPGNGLGEVEQPVDVGDAGGGGLEGRPAFGLHAVKRPGAVAERFEGGEPPEGVEQGGVAFGLDGGHGVGHRGQRPDPAFTDGNENNGDDQGEHTEPVVDEGHGADAEREHQEHEHDSGPNLAELGDGLVNVMGHAGDDVAGAERHDIGNGCLQGGVEAVTFQVDAHAAQFYANKIVGKRTQAVAHEGGGTGHADQDHEGALPRANNGDGNATEDIHAVAQHVGLQNGAGEQNTVQRDNAYPPAAAE